MLGQELPVVPLGTDGPDGDRVSVVLAATHSQNQQPLARAP